MQRGGRRRSFLFRGSPPFLRFCWWVGGCHGALAGMCSICETGRVEIRRRRTRTAVYPTDPRKRLLKVGERSVGGPHWGFFLPGSQLFGSGARQLNRGAPSFLFHRWCQRGDEYRRQPFWRRWPFETHALSGCPSGFLRKIHPGMLDDLPRVCGKEPNIGDDITIS